jgi:hypothetical protein
MAKNWGRLRSTGGISRCGLLKETPMAWPCIPYFQSAKLLPNSIMPVFYASPFAMPLIFWVCWALDGPLTASTIFGEYGKSYVGERLQL